MKTNRGKQFEDVIRKALKRDDFFVHRLQDSMGAFAGVSNPCDFIAFKTPYLYMLECKAVSGNTLNISANLRPNQIDGMYRAFFEHENVVAGFLVWFVDKDIVRFIPAYMVGDAQLAGKKSFTAEDGYPIKAIKKRVLVDPSFIGPEWDKIRQKMKSYRDIVRGEDNGKN